MAVLRRWEDSGAVWRVTSRTATSVDIDLLTCAADEVMGRLRTSDPDVLAHVAGRDRSD